jgi:hypothetical protein
MSQNKLIGVMSPHMEVELMGAQNLPTIATVLRNALFEFRAHPGVSLFFIPNDCRPMFYANPALKALLSLIEEDPQSNVMFTPCHKKADCEMEDSTEPFRDGKSNWSNRLTLNSMYDHRRPIFIDSNHRQINKERCEECAGRKACSLGFECTSVSFSSLPMNMAAVFKTNVEHCIELMSAAPFPEFNVSILKSFAFLVAHNLGATPSELVSVEKMAVTNMFIGDVGDQDAETLVNIAFAMFASLAFPPAKHPSRHKLSIDWHSNDPDSHSGVELFRCDVLEAGRSGISGSGKHRLLFGKHKDKKVFLAFTTDHDFSAPLIRSRVKEYLDSI